MTRGSSSSRLCADGTGWGSEPRLTPWIRRIKSPGPSKRNNPSGPSERPLQTKCLFDAVLLLPVIMSVQRQCASDQSIPVGSVLYDEMEVRYFLEIMFSALRTFIGVILDDRLPAFVPVEGDDVAQFALPGVIDAIRR